jgi:competence protein ComEA
MVLVASFLVGSSLLAPSGRLNAAPAVENVAGASKVSINKADATELESIRGVGPTLAERILQYREANGRFENLEDLVQVPGIGQAKFEKMKDQITL